MRRARNRHAELVATHLQLPSKHCDKRANKHPRLQIAERRAQNSQTHPKYFSSSCTCSKMICATLILRSINLVVDACVITQRRSRRHSNIVFDVCSRAAGKKLQQNCRYGHTVYFVQRTHCHFIQVVKCAQKCTLHARAGQGRQIYTAPPGVYSLIPRPTYNPFLEPG